MTDTTTAWLKEKVQRLEAELAEMRRKLAEMHGARLTWADRALKAEQKIIDMRRTHVKVWEECPDCPTNGDSDCLTCIDGLVLADGLIPFGKDWYAIPARLIEGEG